MRAQVIYWQDEEHLLSDGGGIRVRAWVDALRRLDFEVAVLGIHPGPPAPPSAGSITRSLKRWALPMPLERGLPLGWQSDVDITVVCALATFRSAMSQLLPAGGRVILDWMDLWSDFGVSVARESAAPSPLGLFQSRLWAKRELRYSGRASANTYAGFADFAKHASTAISPTWLPTPRDQQFEYRMNNSELRTLGILGNFGYQPNVLSLERFLKGNAASLRNADMRLQVAGFGSDGLSAIEAQYSDIVDLVGPVAELRTFYQDIDAAIVPIEHGGGIKVKAVEALVNGVPVFATPHVRAGFPNEFHRLLPDLRITPGQKVPLPPTDLELAQRIFSTDAFADSVNRVVA